MLATALGSTASQPEYLNFFSLPRAFDSQTGAAELSAGGCMAAKGELLNAGRTSAAPGARQSDNSNNPTTSAARSRLIGAESRRTQAKPGQDDR
jgi:hypothetical protein